MSILKYFETVGSDALPHLQGMLSSILSEETIQSANYCIHQPTRTKKPTDKKRGSYQKLSEEKKAEVGRYAAENGVAAAVRHFAKELPKSLNESTVRGMKRRYLEELSRKRKAGENPTVESLLQRKRGCPLMLGDTCTFDPKIQAYLRAIRENGGSVGTAIVTAATRGIVIKADRRLLAEYGGPVMLQKTWAESILELWMGFVKHRGTTKSNVVVVDFEARKEIFLSDIAVIVVMEEIPPDLIINWDRTGLNLIPSSS